ncbi:MAG: ABC transporter permease [Micromonosporaceae bacterium]|nr:ABC transporter permease [Micromonosporaceae bacterium]
MGHGRVSPAILPVVGLASLLGIWWGIVVAFDPSSVILPSPPEVVRSFLAQPGIMLGHAGHTLVETLLGFALATVIGWLVATALTASRIANRTLYPLLVALNAVPKVAVAPLLVLWLGFGLLPKVLLVFTICFFPVVISAATGLAATPPEFVELARSLEARPWKAYLKIRLPGALPQLFIGLKVAITLAVIGAVVAEFQGGTDAGLGYLTIVYSGQGLAAGAFVAIVLLAVMSVGLFYLVAVVERLLIPWAGAMHNRN